MAALELLSPAGNFESVCAACDHGADAVYVGVGPYNLRSHAANFSIEEFRDCIAYCKKKKRKIYAAINAMPDDKMLLSMQSIIESCHRLKARPDAFIVSDPGVLSVCRQYFKTVAMHLSTQTGTFNGRSAVFWKRNGIRRVILPRELSLDRIAALAKHSAVETEVFIHGAMCVSISGRCLLGAYLGKRHPNWGDCPQPCRLRYRIAPQEINAGADDWLTIEEDCDGAADPQNAYILNSKDLNALPVLPGIVATGVSALKIEGRNKSSHYVGTITKVYREAIDECVKNPKKYAVRKAWTDELDRLDHRPYTTGFYGQDYVLQEVGFSQSFSPLRIVGAVKAVTGDAAAVIDVKNPFSALDKLSVLPIRKGCKPFELHDTSLTGIDRRPLERAVTNRIVVMTAREVLRVGDMIRRDCSQAAHDSL